MFPRPTDSLGTQSSFETLLIATPISLPMPPGATNKTEEKKQKAKRKRKPSVDKPYVPPSSLKNPGRKSKKSRKENLLSNIDPIPVPQVALPAENADPFSSTDRVVLSRLSPPQATPVIPSAQQRDTHQSSMSMSFAESTDTSIHHSTSAPSPSMVDQARLAVPIHPVQGIQTSGASLAPAVTQCLGQLQQLLFSDPRLQQSSLNPLQQLLFSDQYTRQRLEMSSSILNNLLNNLVSPRSEADKIGSSILSIFTKLIIFRILNRDDLSVTITNPAMPFLQSVDNLLELTLNQLATLTPASTASDEKKDGPCVRLTL